MSIPLIGDESMYKLSDRAKNNNELAIGLSFDRIINMSLDEEKQWIENLRKQKLVFSKEKKRGVAGRGNPLLARHKIRTMGDLQKKYIKYFKA